MIEQKDRGEIWDLLVALLCNIEAGIVKTGYAWKDWPRNPILDNQVPPYCPCANLEIRGGRYKS
jgi:hypothetical protein